VRYGGHTSCVAVARDGQPPTLILDAGTGIRVVTGLLDGRAFRGTILLTHLHWDHVQGLPFFQAGNHPDAQVTLLLPDQQDGDSASRVLGRAMSPPHFPIGPDELLGRWTFGVSSPGPLSISAAGFTVEAREIPHKGGRTLGYRVSDGRSVLAYVTDHCPTALGPGPDGWGEYHAGAMGLAADADVLVHDAQLLAEEIPAQAAFGHAAADYAVTLARRAGARRAVLFHHHPSRTDDALDRLAGQFTTAPIRVDVAAEGQVIEA